ncbi:MAG: FKBP-type peptidyl-prolyl cis-trans isomerase [Kangiellaceae bacterium]|nr:FKBP-type peptidyl-prolyl cis-trans isomerase [Kangiellaceae bacterium]MCW9015962.1 FKBP-type peptidyl-prolyl cis-trans isomerase [Kangiellaceae bacterium]
MNKIAAIIATSLLLSACQQDANSDNKTETKAESEKPAATQVEKPAAEASSGLTDQDKMAYGVGASMATNISMLNEQYKALDLDLKMVKQGFEDTLAQNSKLSEEEIIQQSQIFGQKLQFAQQQQRQQEMQEMQANNEKYLTENLAKGFTKTESGLQYKVVTPAAEGAAKPSATDTVKVHYTGTFTDGKKFDSSVDKGQPFTFSLRGGVIQGWLEGVKLMSVGSKFQFVIPPELGYGFNERPGMPSGSILIFDVELLEIVKQEEQAQ